MGAMLDKQMRFLGMLSLLFVRIRELGLPMKIGCAKCDSNHHSQYSLHKDGLAVDLPMVWPDGRYGTWEEYLPLGEYWESIGGTWGGRFDLNRDGIARDDANHFSIEHDGRK